MSRWVPLSSILIHLLCFINEISACSHRISLSQNETYVLNSPNYPDQYTQGTSCQYTVSAPEGYSVDVECNITMKLNRLLGCITDQFLISNTDDPNFEHSEHFCGKQTIRRSSRFQAVTVGYFSLSNSSSEGSGLFQCHFTSSLQPCDCGWNSDTKIAGGHEVKPHQYPFMAGILLRGKGLFCGGSIISRQFILTAAHCVINQNATSLSVLVGGHDLNSTVDSEYTRLVHVEDIIIHENYPKQRKTDIALLRTPPLQWSLGVGPACLPVGYQNLDFAGMTVQLVGWGTQSYRGNDSSSILLETSVRVLAKKKWIAEDSVLTTLGEYKHDSCQGDSGGPVVATFRRMFTVGIIASGVKCDGLGSNTRVTSYLDWILEKTQEKFCQKKI